MLRIDKIQNTKPAALRKWLQEEFLDLERYGDANTIMRAERVSNAMYGWVDIPKMIAELTALLLKYPDFQVEQEKSRLIVRGKRKGEPKEAAGCIRLSLLHKTESDMVIASVGKTNNIYCNQLNFMDNMAGVFGIELALLIQKNETMKVFYLEYLEWLQPYYEQIMELRCDMEERLARIVMNLVKDYQREEPTITPVLYNIIYLLQGIRSSLNLYRLPNVEAASSLNLPGFNIRREDFHFFAVIDIRTFNGLLVMRLEKEHLEKSFHIRLSDYQTLVLVKDFMVELKRQPNPICQVFVQDVAGIVVDAIPLKEKTEVSDVIAELESYLEVLY